VRRRFEILRHLTRQTARYITFAGKITSHPGMPFAALFILDCQQSCLSAEHSFALTFEGLEGAARDTECTAMKLL
jgi:hypothetical protein